MCNNENMQQNYEQIKFSDNTNNVNNKKSSLKRTESKMDESPQGSDDYLEVESDFDDVQWIRQTRPNGRRNKAPRIDYFVQGRTITSSSRGNGRMEKNKTRHISSQEEERKNEKKFNNQQLSNLNDIELEINNDIQCSNIKATNNKSNKISEK
jgi:hypothetical protein